MPYIGGPYTGLSILHTAIFVGGFAYLTLEGQSTFDLGSCHRYTGSDIGRHQVDLPRLDVGASGTVASCDSCTYRQV